ncbi:MAG: ankyrin repeat domain-containing protein [Firmicutes bacterium]|nr:ankyrin repeat domain-containing protein [Bacillota bacterium]
MANAHNIHEAYRQGDLAALKTALNYPPNFPNQRGQQGLDENCLEYAIYHSPISFIRTLLAIGADPNYDDRSFPSLIAALSTSRSDKYDVVLLSHAYGADLQQRGINDYTPLHYAANDDDPRAIELLLSLGADPQARTNVDEFATPLEEAVHLGRLRAVKALKDWVDHRKEGVTHE